jgi:hypothetical protein
MVSRLTLSARSMLHYLEEDSPYYPKRLRQYLASNVPTVITARGNLKILKLGNMLALFCSRKGKRH